MTRGRLNKIVNRCRMFHHKDQTVLRPFYLYDNGNSEWCMYSRDELFKRSRECYFGVNIPGCEATRGINTKITLEWAQKQLVTRVHTLFYFLHDIKNPYVMIKTTICTQLPCVILAQFSFCWWRRNQLPMTLQWPDNCDAITWIVISSSIDVGFIHGDIHGRLRKQSPYLEGSSIYWNGALIVISGQLKYPIGSLLVNTVHWVTYYVYQFTETEWRICASVN